jgi:outer membrane murein-binding lipoprotein Lpp
MKSTISFAALALVNNISAVEITRRAIPDGYHFNYDNLETSIKDTHSTAEAARQSAVNAQEAADAWRKGSTPNAGPVLALSQRRAIPDGYHFNYDNLETSIKDTHSAAEAARQSAVNAQEAADAWRKGSTPNAGPVLSLAQGVDDRDQGYYHSYSNMNNGVTTAHSSAEAARQAAVNAQEAADAWRKGSTPSAGPVYPYGLSQRRAIPDGYHFNYDNLETSIKDTHSAAEAARQSAVNAQEAADAWRKGSTPNAGPVLALSQGPSG